MRRREEGGKCSKNLDGSADMSPFKGALLKGRLWKSTGLHGRGQLQPGKRGEVKCKGNSLRPVQPQNTSAGM